MPQLGRGAEPDAILASQPQAQIHILTCGVRKSLIEREFLRGMCLHAEVQGRHVPEFPPVREQPLTSQGAVDLVVAV